VRRIPSRTTSSASKPIKAGASEKRIKELEAELKSQKAELAKANQQLEETTQLLEDARANSASLSDAKGSRDQTELAEELSFANEQIAGLEEDLKAARENEARLNKENDDLQTRLVDGGTSKTTEDEDLKEQLAAARRENARLHSQIRSSTEARRRSPGYSEDDLSALASPPPPSPPASASRTASAVRHLSPSSQVSTAGSTVQQQLELEEARNRANAAQAAEKKLREELQDYEQKYADLDKKYEDLKREAGSSPPTNDTNGGLEQENALLRSQVHDLEGKYQDLANRVASASVSQQAHELEEKLTEENSNLRSQVEGLEKKCKELQHRVSHADKSRGAASKAEAGIDQLNENIRQLEERCSKLQGEAIERKRRIEEQKETISKLSRRQRQDSAIETAKMVAAQQKDDTIRSIRMELEAKMAVDQKEAEDKYNRMRQRLSSEKKDLERQRDEKKRRLDHVTGNLEKINDMYNKEQAKRDEIEKKFKELQKESKQTKEMLELVKLEKEEIELNLEEKEEDIEDMKEQLETVTAANHELKSQLSCANDDLIKSMPDTDRKAAELVNKNKQLTSALISLRDATTEKISTLEARVAALSEEREKLNRDTRYASDLESSLKDYKEQVTELHTELEQYTDLDQTIEQLQEKNVQLEENLEKSKATIDGLQKLLQANEEMEESHVEIENDLQEEIADKEAEIQDLEKRLKQLEGKRKDQENTIAQFRHLASALQEENSALKGRVGAISSKSKMQVEKVHNAMSKNLKLQNTVSEARVRTAAYRVASMKANEAEQYSQFVQAYVPPTVEINIKGFNLLALLERIRFTSMVIASMLNQYHGLKAPMFDPEMADFVYSACGCTVNICGGVQKIMEGLKSCDELGISTIASRTGTLAAIEKSLNTFLDLIIKDTISLGTSLKPLNESIDSLNTYFEKHFKNIQISENPTISIERLRIKAFKIHFEGLLIIAQAQQLEAYLEIIKEDDPSSGAEQEASKEEKVKGDDEYTPVINDVLAALDTLMSVEDATLSLISSLEDAKNVKGELDEEKVDDAIAVCKDVVGSYYQLLKEFLDEDGARQNGGDGPRNTSEVREEIAKISDQSLSAFNDAVETLHQELKRPAKHSKKNPADGALVVSRRFANMKATEDAKCPIWISQAEAVRKELAEISGQQKELRTARQTLEENKVSIVHLKKEVQLYMTKNKVLSKQLQLALERIANVEKLNHEIKGLKDEIKHLESSNSSQKVEIEQLRTKTSNLRRRYEDEKAKNKRYPTSKMALASGASLAPEEAQAEIQLLRTTIIHLQHEYNNFKWRTTTARLLRDLPPLPSFSTGDQLDVDPNSETSILARELKSLSTKVMDQRACPKLVDLSVNGASQRWLGHVSSLRKLGRQARELQRRLTLAGESRNAMDWVKKVQSKTEPRLVGRVTLPCLPDLKSTVPNRVIVSSSEMTQLCQPLLAW